MDLSKEIQAAYVYNDIISVHKDGNVSRYFYDINDIFYDLPYLKNIDNADVKQKLKSIMLYVLQYGNPYPSAHLDLSKKLHLSLRVIVGSLKGTNIFNLNISQHYMTAMYEGSPLIYTRSGKAFFEGDKVEQSDIIAHSWASMPENILNTFEQGDFSKSINQLYRQPKHKDTAAIVEPAFNVLDMSNRLTNASTITIQISSNKACVYHGVSGELLFTTT